MHILVIGDGKVGHTLVEHLATEGHDVVVVDNNEAVLERTQDMLDVMCVRGNGANAQTLIDAGAKKADIIVAATASDETNMLCCLIAKRLGAKYSIARIRDPEYNESLALLRQELDIDLALADLGHDVFADYRYRNIINTIAGKEEFLIKEHQNIEVTKAIEAFYKSAELLREVSLAD